MDDPFRFAQSMTGAYAAVDWASTPVGDPAGWSVELRAALSLVLTTRFPATLLWGPEFVLLYNHDYVTLIGDKHPAALGQPAEQVFPEAWDSIAPLLRGVLTTGEPTWLEDMLLPLERHGYLEECYFTYAYSPVVDAHGEVAGVLDLTAETTLSVIAARRLALLSSLEAGLADALDPEQVLELALQRLRSDSADFAAVNVIEGRYSTDPDFAGPVPLGDAALRCLERSATGGADGWFRLPAALPSGPPRALAVRLSPSLAPDDVYLDFLALVANTLSAALIRTTVRQEQRRSASVARSISETLQRSLLTDPPKTPGLDIVVRYVPAVSDAEVGGDWYDAFFDEIGELRIVIGDVSGHDRDATATMGHARNVLRGLAYATGAGPAELLSTLDRALGDLAIGSYLTAVLADVRPGPEEGTTSFRWSNAGHPPPLLIRPDGVTVLHTTVDLMLGLDADAPRRDHAVTAGAGEVLLLYTDGLVERRYAHLDDSLAWLADRTAELAGLPPAALCDTLLADIAGHSHDDVALLAIRVDAIGEGPA